MYIKIMYIKVHSKFILTPLLEILRDGVNACHSLNNGIEVYPMGEYYLQSLFLKMTGAQEQKMKCICWEIATNDYEYRYKYLNGKHGEYSSYSEKKEVYSLLIKEIKNIQTSFCPIKAFDSSIERLTSVIIYNIENLLNETQFIYFAQRDYNIFANKISELFREENLTLNDKTFFGTRLQDLYQEIIWKHRNRCAHNLLSYQQDLPNLEILADPEHTYSNYFFRYAILILIDEIFMKLYEKYIDVMGAFEI